MLFQIYTFKQYFTLNDHLGVHVIVIVTGGVSMNSHFPQKNIFLNVSVTHLSRIWIKLIWFFFRIFGLECHVLIHINSVKSLKIRIYFFPLWQKLKIFYIHNLLNILEIVSVNRLVRKIYIE